MQHQRFSAFVLLAVLLSVISVSNAQLLRGAGRGAAGGALIGAIAGDAEAKVRPLGRLPGDFLARCGVRHDDGGVTMDVATTLLPRR